MINKVLVYWLLVNKNLGDKRGTHHSTPIVISNNVENFDSRLCKEENANIIVLLKCEIRVPLLQFYHSIELAQLTQGSKWD